MLGIPQKHWIGGREASRFGERGGATLGLREDPESCERVE
jgi:hypothetical protein